MTPKACGFSLSLSPTNGERLRLLKGSLMRKFLLRISLLKVSLFWELLRASPRRGPLKHQTFWISLLRGSLRFPFGDFHFWEFPFWKVLWRGSHFLVHFGKFPFWKATDSVVWRASLSKVSRVSIAFKIIKWPAQVSISFAGKTALVNPSKQFGKQYAFPMMLERLCVVNRGNRRIATVYVGVGKSHLGKYSEESLGWSRWFTI